MKNLNNQHKSVAAPWNKAREQGKSLKLRNLHKFSSVLLLLLSDFRTKEAAFQLMSRIRSLWKVNGGTFTVLYLKEAHRLTMKAVSGQPDSHKEMRVATRRGLPLIIPGSLRLLMESKDVSAIRIVLTMLSIYRVISIDPRLKISTITDPFSGLMRELPMPEIARAMAPLNWKSIQLRCNARLLQTVKAGPNWSIAGLGGILDAYAFKHLYPELLSELETICTRTGKELWSLFQKELDHVDAWAEAAKKTYPQFWVPILENLKLGKLSTKEEAAGKVRVFAITDLWTQSALKPLHDYLFNILRLISQDGTFNQLGPLMRLMEKGVQEVHSFDLSAATDRLPIDLQVQIISYLVGEKFADAWKNLLVKRPWLLDDVPYFYSVGQPMGALSSWASLALTHHVIIQVAARRVGWTSWFDSYCVLGDDVVIADSVVAKAYLQVMVDLGVSINMSKSLESKVGIAEFAKRLIGPMGDLSPVSPRLVLQTAQRANMLPMVVRDMVNRGVTVQTKDLRRFIDKLPGSKRLGKDFIWNMAGPIGFLNLLGLSPLLGNKSLTEVQLRLVAEATDEVVNSEICRSHYAGLEKAYEVWAKLENSLSQYYTEIKMSPYGKPMINKYLKSSWRSLIDTFRVTNPGLPEAPSTLEDIFVGLPSTEFQLKEIEKTLRRKERKVPNLRDHHLLLGPIGYTNQSVYQYMVDSFSTIDGAQAGIANLLEKPDLPRSFSDRVKLYRQLEEAMERLGISEVLEIRRLPEPEEGGVVPLPQDHD